MLSKRSAYLCLGLKAYTTMPSSVSLKPAGPTQHIPGLIRVLQRETLSNRNHYPPHPTPGEAVAHNFNPNIPKKESNDRLGRSPKSLGRGFLPYRQNNWRFETSALSTLNPVCDEALEPGTGEMEKH